MNEQALQWDDLRIVLAVGRSGSLSGAARTLGVSHATVFRRLRDIERRLGVRLFERSAGGYAPTPAGEDLVAVAGRMETEILEAERRVVGRDLRPSGSLRLTTTDTLLAGLLSPILVAFRREYPAIALEVSVSNQLFDLSRREADVAIRPSNAPPEHLVGRCLGRIEQAVYAPRDAVDEEGEAPAWVGPDEGMTYRALERWMAEQEVERHCHYRADSLMGMYIAVRDGMGRTVLPCYLGDGDARLTRIGETVPALATSLWGLTHPDLRRVARVAVFMRFVATALEAMPALRSEL